MSKRFNRVAEGPFSLDIIDVVTPAAGAEFSHKLEEGYTYFLHSVTFYLQSSVVANNRIVILEAYLADRLLFTKPHVYTQVANELLLYNFVAGGTDVDLSVALQLLTFRLPSTPFIPGGTRVLSNTALLDVGDQFSGIYLYVQKWPILED